MPEKLSRRAFVGTVSAAGVSALAGIGSARGGTPALTPRRVARIVSPTRDLVGEVFAVRRTIPSESVTHLDPFLLCDHFDFRLAPRQLGGLAPHPHRGIETVTVMAEGPSLKKTFS